MCSVFISASTCEAVAVNDDWRIKCFLSTDPNVVCWVLSHVVELTVVPCECCMFEEDVKYTLQSSMRMRTRLTRGSWHASCIGG
jgi:hypothetical protein